MILRCNYEEVRALASGGRSLLGGEPYSPAPVLAPTESRARIEALLPHLVGDLSVESLAQARGMELAVEAIVEHLRKEMEEAVLATHAADEIAVAAYFDFAHALSVAQRLREMIGEMEAVVELVTGASAEGETARTFRFPD